MQAACLHLKADKTLKACLTLKWQKHPAELIKHNANPTRMIKKKTFSQILSIIPL